MKGVILAAGLGTRMRPLTNRRPKPLVPILDRPMIEHIVLGAVDAGVTDLLIVVGYRGEMVREALGAGDRFGISIRYIVQERPTGTGDATLLAAAFIEREPFFLSWGDIIVSPRNYRNLRQAWEEQRPDLLLTVNWVPDPHEGAAVYVEDGRVVRIIEKPPQGASTTHYNNAGIFMLPPQTMEVAGTVPLSQRGEHELPDAIQKLLADGAVVGALPIEGCWSDVARPAEVVRLNGALLQDADRPDPAIRSPQATAAPGATFTPPYILGSGASVNQDAQIGPGAYILAGAVIGPGCRLANCLVMSGARLGKSCVLEWAVVEEGVDLPPDTRLTGSPESPACAAPDEDT